MKNKKGFTLIELLAVIVVLSIIMVIAVISVNKVIENSRKNAFTSNAKIIEGAVKRSNITQDEEKVYIDGKIYNYNMEPIGKLEIDDENLEYGVDMVQGEVYFYWLMSDKLMIDVRKCASEEYCLAKEVSSKVVVKKFEVDKEISVIYPKVKDEKPGDITNGEKAGSVLAGTEELPYEIRSIEDLLAIYNSSLDINGGPAFVTLMVNLDFNNKDSYSDSSRIDYGDINGDKKVTSLKDELTNRSGSGFNPVFSSNVSGSGQAAIYFDGNAKTINNLYINRPSMDNVGLFSLMMGQINGLNLLNINIKGRDNVGGIIGQGGFFMINNCKVTGNITGETQVGLVAGYTDLVEIRQVIASGNVKSTLEVSTNDRPISSGVIAGTAIRNGSVKQTGIFLGGSIKSSDNWCVSLVGKGLMTGYVSEDSLINNQHSFCNNAISAAELRTDVPYKELGFNFTETDPLKEKYIWYMENGKAKLKKN